MSIQEDESDESNSNDSIINSSEVKSTGSQNMAATVSKGSDNEESNDVTISSHTSAGDESKREISIGKRYFVFFLLSHF